MYIVQKLLNKYQNIEILEYWTKIVIKRKHLAPFSVKCAWETYYYSCNNSIWVKIGVSASKPFQAQSDTQIHPQKLQHATCLVREGGVLTSSSPVPTRQLLVFATFKPACLHWYSPLRSVQALAFWCRLSVSLCSELSRALDKHSSFRCHASCWPCKLLFSS